MTQAELAARSLVALLGHLESSERHPSQREASWARTRPLVHLETLWALARVGASRPEQESQWIIELKQRGKVAEAVADCFAQRLDEARVVGPAAGQPAAARSETITPWDRYHVEKALGASQVLSPWRSVDPLAHFAQSGEEAWQGRDREPGGGSCDELLTGLEQLPSHPFRALETVRRSMRALSAHGLEAVSKGVGIVRPMWPDVTDSLSSNLHWCVSRIAFVDAIVFAIAEAVAPLRSMPDA